MVDVEIYSCRTNKKRRREIIVGEGPMRMNEQEIDALSSGVCYSRICMSCREPLTMTNTTWMHMVERERDKRKKIKILREIFGEWLGPLKREGYECRDDGWILINLDTMDIYRLVLVYTNDRK